MARAILWTPLHQTALRELMLFGSNITPCVGTDLLQSLQHLPRLTVLTLGFATPVRGTVCILLAGLVGLSLSKVHGLRRLTIQCRQERRRGEMATMDHIFRPGMLTRGLRQLAT